MAITDKTIPGYELSKSENFFYAGDEYTALDDPSGEFSTTIKVLRHRDQAETEIYIRDGDNVIVHDKD